MNISKIAITAALLASTTLGGCASIISGTNDVVGVNSDPTEAKCVLYDNGTIVGSVASTPGAATVKRSKDTLTVDCTKDGYQHGAGSVNSGGNPWVIGNIVFGLFGGIIGVIVDASSGAATDYEDSVFVQMDKNVAAVDPIIAPAFAPAIDQTY
jgi:hypothetical protein